jgi:peptidoglycan/LPS O-acetylase OafA/YrhL
MANLNNAMSMIIGVLLFLWILTQRRKHSRLAIGIGIICSVLIFLYGLGGFA